MNRKSCFLLLIFLLTSCSPKATAEVNVPADDMLAEIKARGTLVIATDGNYPPQSMLDDKTPRLSTSKCEPTQYTADQFSGFDSDAAKEIAHGLGVEPCFVTPPWTQLIAGNWQNNWDVHVGSVAITFERMKVLYFSQPYFATPAVILIHKDNVSIKTIEDLSGKRIGVCPGCIFEAYLLGTLKLPGEKINYRVKNPQIVAYENEAPSIEDLSEGDGLKLDAVMTQLPVARLAIEAGKPLRILDEPVFFAYASVTLDRISRRNPQTLLVEINQVIQALHDNGTLSNLSLKYHGIDLTREAALFDLDALQQSP